ncbi:MAG: leucine-rich repeat domain-containing protein, partial [Thermoguttaceae bacterium]|nr:leucine-rich repeat domain-containing protein [Thermoguttaceae bacterium]
MRMRQSEERFRGVESGNERTASERTKLVGAIFSNRRAKSVCVALLGAAFVVGGLTASFDASSVRAADEPTVAANVSATTPDAFEYQIEEGFVTITGLREEFREATTVSVPKQIGTGTVKKIASNAFQKRERLETVVFADATALDEIGARAFAGCSALKSVDFGKGGVGVIGDWAFSQCSALTAVELPKSVRVIGTGAFALCSSLATVSGGDGVEEIAPTAFGGCDALETFVIGPNVRKIGSGAFRGCKRLQNFELSASGNAAFKIIDGFLSPSEGGKPVDGFLTSADGKTLVACPTGRGGEVVVPEGVVEIGPGAFMMGALEAVVLPQTLKKIDANAFYSCDALKSVVGAPKALETIGVEAFADCDALERFDWPENLQTIEKQAFRGCGALTTANVKSVRTIGANAFYCCAKLETLELPSATREIGAFAFAETGLKTFKAPRDLAVWNPSTTERSPVEKIEVEEGNAAFQIVDGALLSADGKTLYYRPQNAPETSWKIPDGVRVVAEGALSGAASLTSLEIPEGVETIGAGALRGCSALKKIAIPASLRQIDETFDGCSALTAFEVAEGNDIFSVVDGSLLSKDGKTLYRMARNTEADAAPTEKFFLVGGPGPFATRVVPKGVERIVKGAFGNDQRALTVEIPPTVKQIDAGAFGNCPNVRSIRIPASVEQLDERFDSCSWLATFEVDPANPNYKSVDGALLSKDGKTLYRLVVRNEVYRQNATREEGDSRKKYRYVVPEGVETIKKGAFAGAYRMSEIVFPQSLRKIESLAFNGSPLITSVVIPAGVHTIEVGAFGGCDLREVVLASKSAKFGKTSFLAGDFEAGKLTIRVDDKTLERKVENIEAKMVAEIAEKAASKASEGKSAANEPTVVGNLASVAATTPDAFEYKIEGIGATITGLRKEFRGATAVHIPSKIGEAWVQKIESNAFAGLDRLEALYVNAHLAETGARAFADCAALKQVRFRSPITKLGSEAFAGCVALQLVEHDEIFRVESGAFRGCASLEKFDVAGITELESSAFAGCRSLAAFENSATQNQRLQVVDGLVLSQDGRRLIACPTGRAGEIVVPEGVVWIAPDAFSGGAVESIVFPQTLEGIGEKAFANCRALKSVVGAPKTLETIRAETFASCVALERFDWPENLQNVEKGAFQDCKSLESAAIESVRKIGERAFSGCSKLATLKLPSETREIGAFAFAGTALTSFRLPRDLETLTAWAFDGLALENVEIEAGNQAFKIVDGAVLSVDGKTLYYRPAKASGTSWKIPESVRVVVRGALANNESLVSVEIPEGVETIGSGAFSGCLALQKLAIPASVRRIDDRFERCFALETFEVAEGNSAYRSVDGALLSKDGKTLYRVAREGGAGMTRTVAYWNGREAKRVIPEGVERIAPGAIGDDRLMTSVEIPETVKRIDAGAFGVCDRLSSLVIPASVERLDERFTGCDALETFRLAPGNRNYTNVGGALLSNDCKTFYCLVGKGAWARPNVLAPSYVYEYSVPARVQTIKQNAFGGAWKMRKVVLPQGLRTIERSAFSGATSLTSVTIPASVEKIERGAFVGAPLREVVLESSFAKFDKSAFTTEPAKLTIRVADETLEREKAAAEAKKVVEKTAQETFEWEVEAGGAAKITGVRDKMATSLDIPEKIDGAPVKTLADGAFANLSQLKTVRIGANVERIEGAFRNCANLESVEFAPASDGSGESKLHIIVGGFQGCLSLKKFVAPYSLVTLQSNAFADCSALETVELSPRTQEIGYASFLNCSSLREISVPDSEGFLFIGNDAFRGCDALTSFDAPRKLSGLGTNAFGELERPFQFKLHPDSVLRDVDGMILTRDGKGICAYFGPKTGELAIPEGVERVGQVFGSIFKGADFETIRFPKSLRVVALQAFMESKSLKRVVLPEDSELESIGASAFRGCEALESFDWPKTLKTIGNSAFSGCRLKEFVGGEALEKIDAYAFSNCESLAKIELPSGLREIGNGAFSECGATSIKIPASVQ